VEKCLHLVFFHLVSWYPTSICCSFTISSNFSYRRKLRKGVVAAIICNNRPGRLKLKNSIFDIYYLLFCFIILLLFMFYCCLDDEIKMCVNRLCQKVLSFGLPSTTKMTCEIYTNPTEKIWGIGHTPDCCDFVWEKKRNMLWITKNSQPCAFLCLQNRWRAISVCI